MKINIQNEMRELRARGIELGDFRGYIDPALAHDISLAMDAQPGLITVSNGVPLPTAPVKVVVPAVFTVSDCAPETVPSTVDAKAISPAPVEVSVVSAPLKMTGSL